MDIENATQLECDSVNRISEDPKITVARDVNLG
jgi:hypothetical protein